MQIPDAVLVEIEVPRDTDASFDLQIVTKRQRQLSGIDEIVLSLSAKGLTTGEIAAHFQDVYGARVLKDTISRITDKLLEEMTEWCHRPVYHVVFIDAIHLKVGTGRSPTGRSTSPSAFTAGGERDILGWWVSDGGEGAKFWMGVLVGLC